MELSEIISKIVEQTGMSEEEVKSKIARKREDLGNLISEEGAAYLVAKELGVDLIKPRVYRLKIGNVIGGMRNVNLLGRVVKIDEVREFKRRDGSKGRVASIYLGDDTGVIRLVLWNEETELIKELKNGDAIAIVNAYSRERFGRVELMLGRFGRVEKASDAGLPSIEEIRKRFDVSKRTRAYVRKEIRELEIGDAAEVRATIVKIFNLPPVFYACPICGARLREGERCEEHDKSEAFAVVAGVLDDSTACIRFVAFREVAERILNARVEELISASKNNRLNEILSNSLLGKEMLYSGYVKLNKLFERPELVVDDVRELSVEREIERVRAEIRDLLLNAKQIEAHYWEA